MIDEQQLITVNEAAELAGVSDARIRQLAYSGRLGRKIAGAFWVFTREEIEAYKQQAPHNTGGRPPKVKRDLSKIV